MSRFDSFIILGFALWQLVPPTVSAFLLAAFIGGAMNAPCELPNTRWRYILYPMKYPCELGAWMSEEIEP